MFCVFVSAQRAEDDLGESFCQTALLATHRAIGMCCIRAFAHSHFVDKCFTAQLLRSKRAAVSYQQVAT